MNLLSDIGVFSHAGSRARKPLESISDFAIPIGLPENTHNRRKYHCTADLLYDWFGLDLSAPLFA